jgi:predicted permease
MFSDLRLTLRALARSRSYLAVAVFTLALGIGVNAAMFGLVNALILRGLPFPAQDRLVHVGMQPQAQQQIGRVSVPDFIDLRAAQHSFVGLAAYDTRNWNVGSPGVDPERGEGCLISAVGPQLLREPALLGRWFEPADEPPGAAPVIVLGYAVWQNRFGGSASVIGQPVKVDGAWATVIGVAPQDFRFPETADAWMPLKLRTDAFRGDHWLQVFGRLADGASLDQAQAEVAAFGRRLETAYPGTNRHLGIATEPFKNMFLDEGTRRMVVIMFGAVGLVLLIACANVANLILSRSAVRQKEIAIRSALGATRLHLIRLLLLETSLLSLCGAALGLPLAYGLMAALNAHLRTSTIQVPYWMVLDIDWSGAMYVLGLAVVTCVLSGLWPALVTSRGDLNGMLKESARGSTGSSLSRSSRAMVIGEVVLSVVLLVLSALTIRSVRNSELMPVGFTPQGLFSARVVLKGDAYDANAKRVDFFRELCRRLDAAGDISSSAVASIPPVSGNRSRVVLEGQPAPAADDAAAAPQYASRVVVSGSYFGTLGIPLIAGRTFDKRDIPTAQRVAIVSSKFAEKYWPHENPLGRHFAYGENADLRPDQWITVVGVVAPSLQSYVRHLLDVPQTFVPYTQVSDTASMYVFARDRNPAAAATLATTVRTIVREVDPDQPIFQPVTVDAMVENGRFMIGLIAWIFGIFGAVALVLAGVGLYGVMSYSVSQRTQEIGVRMALGANAGDVLTMILREGGRRVVIGLVIGLPAAYLAGRLLTYALYGVQPFDVPAFGGTLAVLSASGFVACLVPALRAVRVSPIEALRCE